MAHLRQIENTAPTDQVSVLLVDDEPSNLLALHALLDDLGQNLVDASSGEEALRLLETGDFAAILLDIQMPGMDGFQTARRIRSMPRSLHTPIVFITGYDTEPYSASTAYAFGAVDYLVKPVIPAILRAKVAALVDITQSAIKARRDADALQLLIQQTKEYAIFRLDPTGRVVTWNAGAERIKGYKADEIIGQHFSKFYPTEEACSGKLERELEIARTAGQFQEEGWRIRKDGSRFWASVVVTALYDKSGVLTGYSKVTRDQTDKKIASDQAERLLREEIARRTAESMAEEAKRAASAERRHREQLHVTLRSIGDAVIVTDNHGIITFVNPVAEQLTGWESDRAVGQPLQNVFRIINEYSRQTVESPVTKVLREGTIVGLANHTLLISKDGTQIPIDDSGAPIRAEDGSIVGVVLVFRDVTEPRKALEARLRLASIVDSSDDAIISKNLNGIILTWNEGAHRLFGYSSEEIVGKPLATLVPEEYRDELPRIIEKLKRGERVEHFQTVRQRKDGTRIDVSLTISPLKDAAGQIVGASKIARNITHVKRREASLRFLAQASRLLAELLDVPSTLQKVAGIAVPHFADWCAVDVCEPDGSLKRVAVAHVDPEKVELAHRLNRLMPPDPDAGYGAMHIVRTGKSELVSEITEEMVAATVRDPEALKILKQLALTSYMAVPLTVLGKTFGVVTFAAAESRRRYGQEELQLAEDLAHRAAVAIENSRLYGELVLADRRKDEFLAMLAHELRNPLAPIRNALHVLNMPDAEPALIQRAKDITNRQVQHMVRLVDDLLDVSRIVSGHIELRKESAELCDVIRRGIETANPMIDAQGQDLVVTMPPEPIHIFVDPTRLAQVISNLLHNAAKFSEQAGRIYLSAERQGEKVIIRVRDEGSGIKPDLLPHVFELFIQEDRSLERSRGGLGIGLTVVRKLIEMHGGSVVANSLGHGKGSEFTIELPIAREAPPPSPTKATVPATRRSRRVLVVDDNVDAAESVAMLLRMWGHQVRLSHDGAEAVEVAETYDPEVIVLDIGLPGMNGYEVARHLRKQSRFENTLLLAVTGYGQEEDRRRSGDAGFDHHLTKPLSAEKLHNLLASYNH